MRSRQQKKTDVLNGKMSMGIERMTYVINQNGVIERVMPHVQPDANAQEVLAYLTGKGISETLSVAD